MLEKTPDELLSTDGHDLSLCCAGAPIPKGHLTVVGRKDSAVGDGDTVNVTGKIIEDLTGALDGRFRMNDPFPFAVCISAGAIFLNRLRILLRKLLRNSLDNALTGTR